MSKGVTRYVWKVWQGKTEEATQNRDLGYAIMADEKKTPDPFCIRFLSIAFNFNGCGLLCRLRHIRRRL
jgi:hypothetical protein